MHACAHHGAPPSLSPQVEERLRFYDTGEAPRKNLDVMREVIEELRAESGGAPAKKKKDKEEKKEKKEDKKESAAAPEADDDVAAKAAKLAKKAAKLAAAGDEEGAAKAAKKAKKLAAEAAAAAAGGEAAGSKRKAGGDDRCDAGREVVHLHFDRQGGEPAKRDGRDQTRGRAVHPGVRADRAGHTLLAGALRQRAGVQGVGLAPVRAADRRRRPGNRDAP